MDEETQVALTEVRAKTAPTPQLAWSQADVEDIDDYSPDHTTRWLGFYVATLVALIAGLGAVWLYLDQRTPGGTPPIAAPTVPTPLNVVVPLIPPVVAAPTKPAALPPYTAADDQRFLHRLKELGATLYKPQLVLETAHMTCDQFRAGKTTTQVQDELAVALGRVDKDTVEQFASSVQMVYPHCG